jgi:CRP-like cAMP-binding protein
MNTLLKRLQHHVALVETDYSAMLRLAHRIVVKQPGQALVTAGEKLADVFFIEEGWAMRYRILDDGRRQIVNFMTPGDCFDLQAAVAASADHYVSALTTVRIRVVSAAQFLAAMSANASLATAFWWAAVQEESILREHIVRIGRRSARQRCAHLFVELNRRLRMAGLSPSECETLPLTRDVMADSLGLSAVHVSRSIASLRGKKLIETTRGAIRLLDLQGLAELSEFNARYLHLQERPILPRTGDVESA